MKIFKLEYMLGHDLQSLSQKLFQSNVQLAFIHTLAVKQADIHYFSQPAGDSPVQDG